MENSFTLKYFFCKERLQEIQTSISEIYPSIATYKNNIEIDILWIVMLESRKKVVNYHRKMLIQPC